MCDFIWGSQSSILLIKMSGFFDWSITKKIKCHKHSQNRYIVVFSFGLLYTGYKRKTLGEKCTGASAVLLGT
jgi:hypothetical protein